MDQNNPQQNNQPQQENPQPQQPQSGGEQKEAAKPVDNGKIWGIVGYIFPVLFFIPLVMDELKNNPYSKFHANQQLNLFLAAIAVNIVGGVIPILGWFIILPIGSIILIVFAIMGIINAAKGKQKPLPLIGGIKIIK